MKHKHHIIPKHFKSVCPVAEITIDLSIEQHANAHKELYEKYGKWEDWCAWQGLSKMLPREEVIKTMLKESASKGGKTVLDNGNHNFYGGKIQKESQDRLVAEGKHWSFDRQKQKEVKAKMIETGTHVMVSNNPAKRKFMCSVTGVITNKRGFTMRARKMGLEKWPYPVSLIQNAET